MLCFRKFPVATNFMDNRGEGVSIKFFCRSFSVSHCRKTSQGNTQVFQFFWASKKNRDQRSWSSRYSGEIVFSHSTEKFRRGTLPRSTKIVVSKHFMHKREVSRFSVRNLLSHITENVCRGIL